MGGSRDLVRAKAAASRPAHSAPHNGIDPRKVREADAKRMARIGWLVAGGLTLVTGIVLMFVMNTHDHGGTLRQWEESLDEFLAEIQKVDLSSEDSIKATKEKITKNTFWRGTRIQEAVITHLGKLNVGLCEFHKARSLKERSDAIEAHFAGATSIDVLAKDFHDARDHELNQQASEAGGELEARYKTTLKEVTRRYLEALRTAANAAASATTGEGLAPYGPLEDTYRQLLHEAMAPGPTKDPEAQALYEPLWKQTYMEVNQIVAKLFDEAYQNKVPWSNLLADTSGWTIVPSSSLEHTFGGGGLSLVNAAGGQSRSGGLSYVPAEKWRDYVLEVEFKIDSGTLVFYTRIGDKMDTKECPGFSVSGSMDPKVPIEFGKTYTMVISVIGNQLTVTGESISHTENIKNTYSRKGEPGIVASPGTNAHITKLRARHLR